MTTILVCIILLLGKHLVRKKILLKDINNISRPPCWVSSANVGMDGVSKYNRIVEELHFRMHLRSFKSDWV